MDHPKKQSYDHFHTVCLNLSSHSKFFMRYEKVEKIAFISFSRDAVLKIWLVFKY